MYSLYTWTSDYTPHPTIRTSMPYALAYALATKGGYYKAQIVCERFDTVEFQHNDTEMKHASLSA